MKSNKVKHCPNSCPTTRFSYATLSSINSSFIIQYLFFQSFPNYSIIAHKILQNSLTLSLTFCNQLTTNSLWIFNLYIFSIPSRTKNHTHQHREQLKHRESHASASRIIHQWFLQTKKVKKLKKKELKGRSKKVWSLLECSEFVFIFVSFEFNIYQGKTHPVGRSIL